MMNRWKRGSNDFMCMLLKLLGSQKHTFYRFIIKKRKKEKKAKADTGHKTKNGSQRTEDKDLVQVTVSGSSRDRAEGKRRKHVQAAHCVLHCGRSGTTGTERVSMFWVQICTDLSWTKGSVTHLNTWDKATSWEICLFASFFVVVAS